MLINLIIEPELVIHIQCRCTAPIRHLSIQSFKKGNQMSTSFYRVNQSPDRKFSQAFFSIKTCSNRVIKTALGSLWRALQYSKTSARSDTSFIERWALQVGHNCWKRDNTEIHLICQLFMESEHSNCTESINRHFYNIYPIPGSLHLVLTSPDAKIAPQNLTLKFGIFGTFSIFSVFGCIRATFCSIPFCTLLIFFKSRWLRWLPIFYLLDQQFHKHNIINLRQAKFSTPVSVLALALSPIVP